MKILEKLEWNKILEEVQNNALTQMGKIFAVEMPLYDDVSKISYELNLTDEAVKLTNSMLLPPINSVKNIEEILNQAKINRILSEEEILETVKCLRISIIIPSVKKFNFNSRNSSSTIFFSIS